MIRYLLVAVIVLTASLAFAIDTGQAFADPDLQARYESIISEVRCVQCQNQTIKDSNALIASDLRREIRRLIEDGKTDAEIFDFLVVRYGDFVLYRPRMSGTTLILWLAPGVLIALGGLIMFRVIRSRMDLPLDDDEDQGPS